MEQSVREYELTNHLGNVLSTITDKGVITSAQDYYPFGLTLASRSFTEGGSSYRYSFNGKEDDKETGLQDYGMRLYFKKLGRFPTIDPISGKYPELTPYQFASNTPIQAIDLDGLEAAQASKHLIFTSNNNTKIADSETFLAAALALKKKYLEKFSPSNVSVSKVISGKEIVNYINKQADGSIQTLDLFSHGGPQGLWFKPKDGEPIKIPGVEKMVSSPKNNLYINGGYEQTDAAAATVTDSRAVEDISFNKFSDNARIEIHGCNTAGSPVTEPKWNNYNIALAISEKLHAAGKTNAVVVAHYGASGPTSKNSYQQAGNTRYVLYNGTKIYETKDEGDISQDIINKKIKEYNDSNKK